MNPSVTTGIFTIIGGVLGGSCTWLAAREGHRWDRAKADIRRLALQVQSYHVLEDCYAEQIVELEGNLRKAVTVKTSMRDRVEELDDNVRPDMTAKEARKILQSWFA